MSERSKVGDFVGDIRLGVGVRAMSLRRQVPPAPVLIFRPIRPRRYVERLARVVVEAKTAELGEVFLQRDMQLIGNNLLDAGADPVVVKREVLSLEAAIRAEIWRIVLGAGNA